MHEHRPRHVLKQRSRLPSSNLSKQRYSAATSTLVRPRSGPSSFHRVLVLLLRELHSFWKHMQAMCSAWPAWGGDAAAATPQSKHTETRTQTPKPRLKPDPQTRPSNHATKPISRISPRVVTQLPALRLDCPARPKSAPSHRIGPKLPVRRRKSLVEQLALTIDTSRQTTSRRTKRRALRDETEQAKSPTERSLQRSSVANNQVWQIALADPMALQEWVPDQAGAWGDAFHNRSLRLPSGERVLMLTTSATQLEGTT